MEEWAWLEQHVVTLLRYLRYLRDPLEFITFLAVPSAALRWLWEWKDRKKERHNRAWELINTARGSTGDGGRRDALRELLKDGVSLAGAQLQGAHLPEIDLKGADLRDAKLAGASLYGANLEGANLSGADLRGADLSGSIIWGKSYLRSMREKRHAAMQDDPCVISRITNLKNAVLVGVDLRDCWLIKADLQKADLSYSEPTGVHLKGANLKEAVLRAIFDDADLAGADLTGADLHLADLTNARNLEPEQLVTAVGDPKWTLLPKDLQAPRTWYTEEALGTLPGVPQPPSPTTPPPSQPPPQEPAPDTPTHISR